MPKVSKMVKTQLTFLNYCIDVGTARYLCPCGLFLLWLGAVTNWSFHRRLQTRRYYCCFVIILNNILDFIIAFIIYTLCILFLACSDCRRLAHSHHYGWLYHYFWGLPVLWFHVYLGGQLKTEEQHVVLPWIPDAVCILAPSNNLMSSRTVDGAGAEFAQLLTTAYSRWKNVGLSLIYLFITSVVPIFSVITFGLKTTLFGLGFCSGLSPSAWHRRDTSGIDWLQEYHRVAASMGGYRYNKY